METKVYKVRFFVSNVGIGETKVSELLEMLANKILVDSVGPALMLGSYKYQMRELVSLNGGKTFKGSFGKLRDDAPHIASEKGLEKPITLQSDEHLIEKNYFLYSQDQELLTFQTNFSASDCSKLAQYLTTSSAGKATVHFSDVLKPDALTQLLEGNIKSVEVGFARPKKLSNFAHESDWSSNMMQLLKGSGAGTISVKVSTRSKTQALTDEMKDVVKEFLQLENTRTLKVKLDNFERPIDLIAECIRDEITVLMNGNYPNNLSIYAELDKAKDRQKVDLDMYFNKS